MYQRCFRISNPSRYFHSVHLYKTHLHARSAVKSLGPAQGCLMHSADWGLYWILETDWPPPTLTTTTQIHTQLPRLPQLRCYYLVRIGLKTLVRIVLSHWMQGLLSRRGSHSPNMSSFTGLINRRVGHGRRSKSLEKQLLNNSSALMTGCKCILSSTSMCTTE